MTKALIRSMDRRGSRSDKSPPVARSTSLATPRFAIAAVRVFGQNLAAWAPGGS